MSSPSGVVGTSWGDETPGGILGNVKPPPVFCMPPLPEENLEDRVLGYGRLSGRENKSLKEQTRHIRPGLVLQRNLVPCFSLQMRMQAQEGLPGPQPGAIIWGSLRVSTQLMCLRHFTPL